MRKLPLFLVCFIVFFFSVSVAASAADMYAGVRGGLSIMPDSDVEDDANNDYEFDFDPGYTVSGFIGGRINENLRIEPEVSYQESDIDEVSGGSVSLSASGDVSSLSFIVNLYYDFVNASPVTPYINLGIGISQIDVGSITLDIAPALHTESDDDSVLAYQAGAGVGWEVTERVTVDFMYRYFGTDDPSFSDAEYEMDFCSHNVIAGFRYSF